MMRRQLFWVGVVAGIVIAAPVQAESPSDYAIYSWRDGNDWRYSILPKRPEPPITAEIKQAGTYRGASQVKHRLLSLGEGKTLAWQEKSDSQMVLPPDDVVEDLRDYAQTVGVELTVARRDKTR